MHDSRRQRRERGTSLVEVMITLAILVTLGSAFASTVRNMAPAYRWQQGTREVVDTLREARQYAIAKNVRVTVKQVGDRLVAMDPDGLEIVAVDVPSGVTLTFPALGVLFMPTAACSKFGAITVAGAGGGVKTIDVNGATGRVRVS